MHDFAVHHEADQRHRLLPPCNRATTQGGERLQPARNTHVRPWPVRRQPRPHVGQAIGGLAEYLGCDVVLIDPDREWTYDPAQGFSKSRNSPWAGRRLHGRVTATIVGGRLVYHHERGVLIR